MPACGTGSARPRRRARSSREVGDEPAAPNRNPPPVEEAVVDLTEPTEPAALTRRRRGVTVNDEGFLMSVLASIRSQLAPIHREGHPFIGIFALASLILFWLWSPLGWLGTMLTLWCVYFFRDPARVTPMREGIVVSPADGRVSRITNAVPPTELELGERPLPRVSIFMSVFDCHVNRSPVTGRIERIVYHAGRLPQRRSRQGERETTSATRS